MKRRLLLALLLPAVFAIAAIGSAGAEQGKASDEDPLAKYNRPLDLGPEKGELKLTLEQAIETAVRNNLGIEGYRYGVKASEQDVVAEEAAFDHVFFASIPFKRERTMLESAMTSSVYTKASYTFGFKKRFRTGTYYQVQVTDEFTHYTMPMPGNRATLMLTIAQPLMRNAGRRINTAHLDMARNNREMALLELENQLNDLVYQVTSAYWNLALARASLEVALNGQRLAEELYRTTKNMVESGVVKKLELLRAESGVAAREDSVQIARMNVKAAEDHLKMLLNPHRSGLITDEKVVLLDSPTDEAVECSFEECVRRALSDRPDLRKARVGLVQRKIGLDVALNQLKPKVDISAVFALTGIAADYGDNWEGLGRADYYTWQIGLDIEYPLGNRAAKAALKKAEYEFRQTKMQVLGAEQGVMFQVRNAIRKVRTNLRRIRAARIATRLAERSLREEEERYRVGQSTSIEVLRFQTDLIAAQTRELQAIIDYNLAIAELNKVRASNLTDNRIDVEEFIEPRLDEPSWSERETYRPLLKLTKDGTGSGK